MRERGYRHMDKEFSEALNTDENGQLSFLDPADNYYPVASDYAKIPNRFVERFGNISYLANLGLMYAITKVEKRRRDMYDGTEKGLFFADVYTKTGTDYSQGLVAEFPINEFLKTFNLNRGGRSYNAIDTLYNGELLKNQWQILYQDEDIIVPCVVVIRNVRRECAHQEREDQDRHEFPVRPGGDVGVQRQIIDDHPDNAKREQQLDKHIVRIRKSGQSSVHAPAKHQ